MSEQNYISTGGVEGCCCFATISTSEVGVIERFGKFDRFVEVSSLVVGSDFLTANLN